MMMGKKDENKKIILAYVFGLLCALGVTAVVVSFLYESHMVDLGYKVHRYDRAKSFSDGVTFGISARSQLQAQAGGN